MVDQTVSVSRIQRKQKLIISVIRACKKCGAPGFWHNTPGVNVGCYAPEKVTHLGSDPVGTICPQCGAEREEIERKGEVWSRTWRVSLLTVLKEQWRNLVKPLRWRIK